MSNSSGNDGRKRPDGRWKFLQEHPVALVGFIASVLGILAFFGITNIRNLTDFSLTPETLSSHLFLAAVVVGGLGLLLHRANRHALATTARGGVRRGFLIGNRMGWSLLAVLWLGFAYWRVSEQGLRAGDGVAQGADQAATAAPATPESPTAVASQAPGATVAATTSALEGEATGLIEVPGYRWLSTVSTFNAADVAAAVTIDVVMPDQIMPVADATVAPKSAWTLDFASTDMPPGMGSAIVSSDQRVSVLTFMEGTNAAGAKLRYVYEGMSSVDTTLFYPIVKQDDEGITTQLTIQNAGATPRTFKAIFTMQDGSTYSYTSPPIEPGASRVITPSDAQVPTSSSDPRSRIGSAIVTAEEAIAGILIERNTHSPTAYTSVLRALTTYDASSEAYLQIRARANTTVSLFIFNIDERTLSATVNYGTVVDRQNGCTGLSFSTVANNILPQTSQVVTLGRMPDAEAHCAKWATIEAQNEGRFIASANETAELGELLSSVVYLAQPYSSLTKEIAVPYFLDQHKGVSSRFQIRNMGAAAASLVASFVCQKADGMPFSFVTKPITLPPLGVYTFHKPSLGDNLFVDEQQFPPNSYCSVYVESDQPIAGYNRELSEDPQLTSWVNHDAFNLD